MIAVHGKAPGQLRLRGDGLMNGQPMLQPISTQPGRPMPGMVAMLYFTARQFPDMRQCAHQLSMVSFTFSIRAEKSERPDTKRTNLSVANVKYTKSERCKREMHMI